jgi:hypothetical protein
MTMQTATMWKCCELKIYHEICVHVEWWHHSMNVEEATYDFNINNRSEYIALEHDAQQKVWMWKFINELKLNDTILSITLLEDNESSIKLVHNVKQHSHTKHIDVQHHYIWNMIDNKSWLLNEFLQRRCWWTD